MCNNVVIILSNPKPKFFKAQSGFCGQKNWYDTTKVPYMPKKRMCS